MYGIFGRPAAIMTAALVLLVVFGVTAIPPAEASPSPSSGALSSPWAYGVVKNLSWGPHRLADVPGWVWQGDVTIGFSVILSQTNTSPSTFELDLNRSMGVRWDVTYTCQVSCASPSEFLSIHYAQTEVINASLNLTDQGTVLENGTTAVPAFALLNSTTHVAANLTNTGSSNLPGSGMMSGMMVNRSTYLTASVVSTSQASFAPYLGLFPQDLSTAQAWSSNASFSANGATGVRYLGAQMSSSGTGWTLPPAQASWPVSASGIVSLSGTNSPNDAVNLGGVPYPALHLLISGPFAVREGFLLIPDHANLFGGSEESWSGNETGEATASMATLNALPSSHGHFGLAASSWQFLSSSLYSMDETASTGALMPAIATPSPVASVTLQASPLSVDTAQTFGSCLTNGTACPAATTVLAPMLRGLLFSIAVTTLAVAVVATLAIVLITERRRLPPPAYPNAHLYPPGAAGLRSGALRATGQRPDSPPSPSEEDPLDHLW